jgi:hypothetical protein
MTLDEQILGEARAAREALLELERQQEHARVDYHHQIRRLHAAGGSLREIAEELSLSHQRVHQIVGEDDPLEAGFPGKLRELRRRREKGAGFFTRFTKRARDAVAQAQREAADLGHAYVGTEHILLALYSDTHSVAARALAALGVRVEDVRAAIEREVGLGDCEWGPDHQRPFTPKSKRSLELALREALKFGHQYIGTEHVLLGVAGVRDSVGARALAELGADRKSLETVIRDLLAA